MKTAIATELPTSRHRWCKWHVLKKAKESLGGIYSKNSAFKKQLHELVDEIVSIPEFETRWAQLVEDHGLRENSFLTALTLIGKCGLSPISPKLSVRG